MTNKELFKQAVSEGLTLRINQDTACAENIICRDGYYRKVSEIFGFEVTRPNPKRKMLRRTALAALIAAALLLAGCAAVVYKEQIRDFFVEIHDTYIKGDFIKDENANNQIIEEYYTLTYVPEGYELVEEHSNAFFAQSVWKNDKEKSIIFDQSPINSGKYSIDGEHGSTNILNYDQYTVYCRIIDETCLYIWNNEKYAFSLYSDAEIKEEEFIRIIEGISMKSK